MLLMFCCAFGAVDTVYAQYPGAEATPEWLQDGVQSISETESERLLRILTSSEFSGRGTGQVGYQRAALWFAEQLKQLNFQPAGVDGSWFQNVPFVRLRIDPLQSGIQIAGLAVGDVSSAVDGVAFGISRFVGTFDQHLPVSFAVLSDQDESPPEGMLSGRVLIVKSSFRIDAGDPLIGRLKPAAVLVVTEDRQIRTESVSRIQETPVPLPTALISESAAASLADKLGIALELSGSEYPKQNLYYPAETVVHCRFCVERESVDVPNVLGWYPGADPQVNGEHIALGAHLDHLGVQQGKVYPGADDNGSGSTAILQIAKAISVSSEKPDRSVLVMAFCAEERGLLGSKYYVESPTRPLADMICMLNIDMIGRNEQSEKETAEENEQSIHLVGSRHVSSQLHDLILDANRYIGLKFEYDEERVNLRSDHASFAGRGVPAAFLFGGFNPHYHQPTDTVDGINFSKIANVARLNYVTLMMAADHGHFRKDVESSGPEATDAAR